MAIGSSIRFRIVLMKKQGFPKRIIKKRLAEEGVFISWQTINTIIKRFDRKGTIASQNKKGRPSNIKLHHMDFIDKAYEKNDELTSVDLQKMLSEELHINLSLSSIKRLRKKLGWIQTGPRYCQAIRPANCEKRLAFAKQCLKNKETFDDVIFTDESSIIIDRHARVCFRKEKYAPKLKAKIKHPVKVIFLIIHSYK